MYAIFVSKIISDPEETPLEDGVILVDGEQIVEINQRTHVSLPARCKKIRLIGATALPGLIDGHAHASADIHAGSLQEQYATGVIDPTLRAVRNLRRALYSGVTTMRLLGERYGLLEVALRNAATQNAIIAPDLVVSGQPLRPRHGTAAFMARPADTPDELLTAVRDQYHLGADWIKIFATNRQKGHTYLAYLMGDLTEEPGYTHEQMRTIVVEAQYLHMEVAAHAIGGPAVEWAIKAGVRSIEHGNLLSEQDIDLLLHQGAFLSDPNLQLFFDTETGFSVMPTWQFQWWRNKVLKAQETTRMVMQACLQKGVKVVLGTDSIPGSLPREVIHLVKTLGWPITKALCTVTKWAAEMLKMENYLGTLAPGKYANILIVKGDPLVDISALLTPVIIVKRGMLYKTD
jgi:imidazolonepropionase-like amidohydrolase